ncbi:hypothetical protein GLOTRDRAFT_138666 [Gloeophyllum trabeum ATCC 11539]|uniref:Uncharacterized protein n=1 Tax=Gloeophyllum trabeum (strain ATCC 11539 / FP-39264 / Madison 617) TaxID=670483 RepID=S7RSF3_GLOTA|nr:uncharacterized protein GLOTRDRAFT_138666 [Gloeophyllum trabeum ATCC 11539]EPQ55954.1 hypothetical protein GLOTRDRAFT_138666 [Gloeophyllum trabeum ATCC 11539]
MAPPMAPGEPRKAPKPQPMGNFPLVVLLTVCMLCILFVLWRRASELRTVVSHQLKTWSGREGNIRLSEDNAPPAREFLDDDYDDDNAGLEDDEPLAYRAEQLRMAGTPRPDGVELTEQGAPLPVPRKVAA